MVKRYSDLNRLKVDTGTQVNVNLGRVDTRPVQAFFNAVSKSSDQFRQIAIKNATDRAKKDAKENAESATFEIHPATNKPIYDPILDGGSIYNQTYEEIYDQNYLAEVQTSFGREVSDIRGNHVKKPDSAFSIGNLPTDMEEAKNNILDTLPLKFKNDFTSYADGTITRILDAEKQQVGTNLVNQNRSAWNKTKTTLLDEFKSSPSKENETKLKNHLNQADILFGPDEADALKASTEVEIKSIPIAQAFIQEISKIEEGKGNELIFVNNRDQLMSVLEIIHNRTGTVNLKINGEDKSYSYSDIVAMFPTEARRREVSSTIRSMIELRSKQNTNAVESKQFYKSVLDQANKDIRTFTGTNEELQTLQQEFINSVENFVPTNSSEAFTGSALKSKTEAIAKIETLGELFLFNRLKKKEAINLKEDEKELELKMYELATDPEELKKALIIHQGNHPNTKYSIDNFESITATAQVMKQINIEELDPEKIEHNLMILNNGVLTEDYDQFYLDNDNAVSSRELIELAGSNGMTAIKKLFDRFSRGARGEGSGKKVEKLDNMVSLVNQNIYQEVTPGNADKIFVEMLKDELQLNPQLKDIDLGSNTTITQMLMKPDANGQTLVNSPEFATVISKLHNLSKLPKPLHGLIHDARYLNLKTIFEQSLPILDIIKEENENLYFREKNRTASGIGFLESIGGLNVELNENGSYSGITVKKFETLQDLFQQPDILNIVNNDVFKIIGKNKTKENVTTKDVKSAIQIMAEKQFKNDEDKLSIYKENLTDITNAVYSDVISRRYIGEDSFDVEDYIQKDLSSRVNRFVPSSKTPFVKSKKVDSIDHKLATNKEITITSKYNGLESLMSSYQVKLASEILSNGNVSLEESQPNLLDIIEDSITIPDVNKDRTFLAGKLKEETRIKDFNTIIASEHNLELNFNNANLKTNQDILTPSITINGQKQNVPIVIGKNARLQEVDTKELADGSTNVTYAVQMHYFDKNNMTATNKDYLMDGTDIFKFTVNRTNQLNNAIKNQAVLDAKNLINNNIKIAKRNIENSTVVDDKDKPRILENLSYKEFSEDNLYKDIKNGSNYIAYHRDNLFLAKPNENGEIQTVKGTIISLDSYPEEKTLQEFLKNDSGLLKKTTHYLVPTIRVNAQGKLEDVPQSQIVAHAKSLGLNNLVSGDSVQEVRQHQIRLKKVIDADNKTHQDNQNIKAPLPMFTENAKGVKVTIDVINEVLDLSDKAFPSTKSGRDDNFRMMLSTAKAESKFGLADGTFNPDRVSTGIFQFDKRRTIIDENGQPKDIIPIFADLQKFKIKSSRKFAKNVEKMDKVINEKYPDIDFKFSELQHSDLRVPFNAAVVMRLWLMTIPSSYKTIDQAAKLYKDRYNSNDPNAKGSEEGFKLLNRYFYNKDVQDIIDGY